MANSILLIKKRGTNYLKKWLFLVFPILATNCCAQISFEKGYYIDNSNQKVDCLIKNVDWKNNPTSFEYKLSENNKSIETQIRYIQEFGIYNVSKYIRSTVNIDISNDLIDRLNTNRNPIFKEEEVFLKVLVEGRASLYLYLSQSLERYFYNFENSEIDQLIYKRFIISDNRIGTNYSFKQQLWNHLKCRAITMNTIEKLKYNKNKLVNFFVQYNSCINSSFVNFEEKQKKDLFNLTLRPRLNNSSLIVQSPASNIRTTKFGNKLGLGLGVEVEIILPYHQNKWAILAEPTYQHFKSENTINTNNVSGGILLETTNYNSIELPVGLRRYFFLNDKSKIFINASLIIDFDLNSSLEFATPDGSFFNSIEFKTGNNLAIGIGYQINNKFSSELRYLTPRDVLRHYVPVSSDYKTISVIFGYTFY